MGTEHTQGPYAVPAPDTWHVGHEEMKIGFLASHNGSNMQAIVDACKSGSLQALPVVTISNNSGSGALTRAAQEGIPCYHLSSATHPEPADLDQAILDALLRHGTDTIVLAGYMKRLGPRTLSRFRGRVLNIHPALLPKFGGKGMYGMNVHRAIIAAGEHESGVSIHVVDTEYDAGPVIARAKVPVEPTDTPETLAERVLQREHTFFPETLQRIVTGELHLPTERMDRRNAQHAVPEQRRNAPHSERPRSAKEDRYERNDRDHRQRALGSPQG